MKAKTKASLITVLNAILGVVFAFIIGVTFCTEVFTYKRVESSTYSTGVYCANKEYKTLINSTAESPVPFGIGSHATKIALEYLSYSSFDIRLQYSLSWVDVNGNQLYADQGNTTPLSTNNVILNFAGRDRFIVDNNYIYVKDTISSGHGTLNIINSVSFADTSDNAYEGANLKITISFEAAQVSTYSDGKSSAEYDNATDTTANPLYTDTIAGRAWVKYKSGKIASEGNAHIIVYNSRSSVENGISYPNKATAERTDITTINGESSSTNTLAYGNRYYAGAGLYVMTGNSSVTINVAGVGSWEKTAETEDIAFDNNILYNFNSRWSDVTYNKNHASASIKIAANQQIYIDIFDSIEITSVLYTDPEGSHIDYTNYKYVSLFSLNGETIQTSILELTLTGNGSEDKTGLTSTDYSVMNTSLFNPGLYDTSAGGTPSYGTDIVITNNTSVSKLYSIGYKVKYTASNGLQKIQDTGSSNDLLNVNNYWARVSDTYKLQGNDVVISIAPYSSVSLLSYFQVNESDLTSKLTTIEEETIDQTTIKKEYVFDAWLDIELDITTGSLATKSSVSIERKDDATTLTYTIRNNSNKAVNISSQNIIVESLTKNYQSIPSIVPDDFETQYGQYYYLDNGKYIQATSASQWNEDLMWYSLTIVKEEVSTFTINETTLTPNETIVITNITKQENKNYIIQSLVNSTEIEGNVVVEKNATANASLWNLSQTESYYVRFTGTYTGSDSNVVTENNYNYYIGIIRPGQEIAIPLSSSSIVETILVADTYEKSDLSEWNLSESSAVFTAFEKYFNK